MDRKNIKFIPDFIVSPGEILKDELEAIGMSQEDLSYRTNMPKKTINELINGKVPLSPETAISLSKVVGRSKMFWLNLESAYRTAVESQNQ